MSQDVTQNLEFPLRAPILPACHGHDCRPCKYCPLRRVSGRCSVALELEESVFVGLHLVAIALRGSFVVYMRINLLQPQCRETLLRCL